MQASVGKLRAPKCDDLELHPLDPDSPQAGTNDERNDAEDDDDELPKRMIVDDSASPYWSRL